MRWKLNNNQYELSQHAEDEKEADKIPFSEIDETVGNLELVENYPDDPRGPSCLVLGFTAKRNPIHFVCGNLEEEKILIITMYRPIPQKWINFRTRKG
ncbi:MAG: DUF4258 domain-containing protein [bacterium]|nr:DUF4258 domain-containing protein [bacterium]